ncbi:hypothetical protein DICSQDRAFT_52495 [Dichomitus squalens LYAD-421 SS1]|uniref:uncharacterized protein n=1 Tax=Dichomitus squalens (strain LYAD-421) TaxID=732165 RepID=UPI0004413BA3|nr:uncharacterized protein DICSQDRAFT_52495 [Dichomitus squalens LYAD-421 SS1]EJF64472.1 hypothetical protein DICSQDRAFT_52495 [Dichomitus squalens LYAD-421 SS1]
MVAAAETAQQTTQTEGYLVFLLFIPILTTIWIWMIVSKPAIVFHISQTFFNFLAMCTMAGAAGFQQKWKVGPSGLTGFAIFIAVLGVLYSLFILLVPVVYEKYDKGARLARALRETRVGFILSGAGTAVSLLIAFIVTISAWTEPGCKDPSKDPHAKLGKDFQKGLSGFCSTKKAAAIFFWLVFVFWCCSLTLTVLDWRNGKTSRPRDPPFTHPVEQAEGSIYERADDHDEDEISDEEAGHKPYSDNANNNYSSPFSDANRLSGVPTNASSNNLSYQSPSAPAFSPQPAGRPSIDAYGAFSDPAPSGFAGGFAPSQYPDDQPRVSRTMQYADPYAAVRASIAGSQVGSTTPPASGAPPPGYTSYGGYR